ncbi:MAG TPA: IS481 family transposase, partial [Chthonomonadales bacterium]|nr:IS481 family transposase [Chthonomonadales bacterium]
RAIELRRQRRTICSIAQELSISKSVVALIVKAEGLSSLKALDPEEPHNRYEHEAPGGMLHVDIKPLARFNAPGHRVTRTRPAGAGAGVGGA